ncbi:heparin sulfate O-sulfotransferase, partial [Agrilus planipennis]|uniref:Heparin sulfate O-sulfotransferase n=1 Tax=Agrilus planipennis TaxID=224129 RepID=A0A1W4WYF9_AGRPL
NLSTISICTLIYYGFQISYLFDRVNNIGIVKNKISYEENYLRNRINHEDNLVVIYNRVPKTASTSFVGIAYDLCKQNKFHVVHINVTSNNHILSLSNQIKLAWNISQWDSLKPALYHGHFAFLDFQKYGNNKPFFINIIRKPLDRMVSYYYFLRYGDNFRPYLVRRKHGDTMTFDECVINENSDCSPNNMWLQVPFFCGHAANCWKPASKWALTEAKKNLINNYLVVGVTEELKDFVQVLELSLPRMFSGAVDYFMKSNKSHLRQTIQKTPPSEETINILKQSPVWQMENDFYEFALEQFHFIKKQIQTQQKFIYEKIRPK